MNWTTLQGDWNQAKGKLKSKWGRLTDDDLMQAQGHKDRLVGMIQQRYGIGREKAEEQLEEFMSNEDGWLTRAKEGVSDAVDKGKEYVEKGKEYVQNTSISRMASDLKELIAKHPVHSAVIGIGLGFLIGRMLTSAKGS
jgi:uncharacterized protein YjbJ (UPF0337 family)